MNIIILLWAMYAAVLWGNWRKISDYYSTMLYMSSMNLLYMYFAFQQYPLWILEPEFFFSESGVFLLHISLIYPLTVFIFLSNYPQKILSQVIHITKWIVIYGFLEWVGHNLGRISYHNGWHFGWSIFFLLMMFPMLRLHYTKKVWAISLSVIWVLIFLLIFDYYNLNPWRDIQ